MKFYREAGEYEEAAELAKMSPGAARAFVIGRGLDSELLGVHVGGPSGGSTATPDAVPPATPSAAGFVPFSGPARIGMSTLVRGVVEGLMKGPAAEPPSPPRPPANSPVGGYEWQLNPGVMRQVMTAVQRQGGTPVERLLLDSPVVEAKPLPDGGTNHTVKVDLGNGMYGFHKSFEGLADDVATSYGQSTPQQPIHEVAAWRLAERMGPPWSAMVAPVVMREVGGEMGSLALERPGEMGRVPTPTRAADAAAFFDALIGQQDRHGGNYLVNEARRVSLIDHGYAFKHAGDAVNLSAFQSERYQSVRGRVLQSGEKQVLSDLLADRDSFGLRGLIEDSRLDALHDRAREMLKTGELIDPRWRP